ncbi:MAG: anti-sigma factor [Xanthobacteraceae bacterium]
MYDDDRDTLAAEYVLGTLSADERDQAEALLVIDPGFAEIVRVWERRLGELNVMVEAVEPAPEVWDRIKTEIDGAEGRIAAEAEAALPTIEDAAPQTAPETLAEITPEPPPEVAPEIPPEPHAEATPEVIPELAPVSPSDAPPPDLLSEAAQNLDAPPSQEDLDDNSAVAALASSLLPPEPPVGAPNASLVEPATTPAPAPAIERSADVIYLARQTKRWRGFTLTMSAIAALLAIYIAVGQFAPGLLPTARLSQSAATIPPPGSRLVAVLQQEPTAPAFLVTVDPQARTMTVRRMTASADSGRSYELWLISSKYPKPQSLGLVGAEEFTTRPLPTSLDADAMRAASYAVSLEPAAGAPNGVPTGPILFTGKMVESIPPPPPPKT